MVSVLLANAPYSLEERYGKLATIGATLPNIGLLMLGAVLRKAGYNVKILDASALGLNYDETIYEVKNFKPDIVGLSTLTPLINRTVKLSKKIKSIFPEVPIIIGGAHITAIPEETLKNQCFDYGVIGEGEVTIVELVEKLASNQPVHNIKGIVFRENSRIRITDTRPPIPDIDTLPFPAWEMLEDFPENYHPAIFKYKKLPSTHIISSRGCPYRCIFCDTSVFSRNVRYHSPEYVLEMITHLKNKFGIKEIIFEDDQFLANKERVETICKNLIETRVNISWCCSARVNSANDINLLRLMKRAGCWQINYGIESGNQQILNNIKKGITLEQIERAVTLTHKAGISAKGYFIFGSPQETEDTMQDTIQLAKRLPLDDISVFMMTPLPGSEIYALADKYGFFEKEFDKMNILDIVFVPKGLSKEILLRYQKRLMKEFYLRPRIILNYLLKILFNPLLVNDMVKAFAGFIRYVFKF
ncbi:MAG: radical SAM protein [Candidatus Hydrogenedentota bacterium]